RPVGLPRDLRPIGSRPRGTRLFAEEERVTASGLERYVDSGPEDPFAGGRTPSADPTAPMP
ncbi:hypothetical protein ACWDVV_41800, partial [Streptomyces tendae]